MPAIHKTIYPRIRKYLEKKGVLKTAWRCLLGPYQLINEHKNLKHYKGLAIRHEFDVTHGVETSTRAHPTDLKISSPNSLSSAGYWPTPPELFHEAFSTFSINYSEFTFIDFGSGKARVLLLASDYPFRKIIGVEFSS